VGLGIRDQYHNLGFGGVFFAYLVAFGRRQLRKEAIGLTVHKQNVRACHLYEKHGFRIVGEATCHQDNDSWEMRLDFRKDRP